MPGLITACFHHNIIVHEPASQPGRHECRGESENERTVAGLAVIEATGEIEEVAHDGDLNARR